MTTKAISGFTSGVVESDVEKKTRKTKSSKSGSGDSSEKEDKDAGKKPNKPLTLDKSESNKE